MGLIPQEHMPHPLPGWVPGPAQVYLAHTEAGLPIRELARQSGCHASTILRQIRKVETRRDDPLVDAALRELSQSHFESNEGEQCIKHKESPHMTTDIKQKPDEATIEQEGFRVLRRLCESGAILAIATNMDKAIVVRNDAHGNGTRTAVVDRNIAQAMALKEWIEPQSTGRIIRYRITTLGRNAFKGMQAKNKQGLNQEDDRFLEQHREWGEKVVADTQTGRPRRMRYNMSESPLTALARRRDKDGAPFLSPELVHVGERLREDFELAQMGPSVAQNWERFLTAGGRGCFAADSGIGDGPSAARARVADAMSDLGAGLADVALRCCCYLEGLESAEKRLGWSARSGKIVLRIALMRLKQHYERTLGPGGGLIG